MASETSEETLLGLCNRATQQGNNISVRMLEFLTTVKRQPLGFRDLGHDFLDICRILTSIDVGLGEFLKTSQQFPPGMIEELVKKFEQTIDDFTILESLLQKFIDYEKGGAVAMLQKTWCMVFSDKDIAKVHSSLRSNRDALKMSMLVFRW